MEEVIAPEFRDQNQLGEVGTTEGLSGGIWKLGRTVVAEDTTLDRDGGTHP